MAHLREIHRLKSMTHKNEFIRHFSPFEVLGSLRIRSISVRVGSVSCRISKILVQSKYTHKYIGICVSHVGPNPRPHLLFRHPRPDLGGCHPRLVCPQIEIELCNKDQRKDRDVLNLTIPYFTILGHILTFPGQIKQKMLLFGKTIFCK